MGKVRNRWRHGIIVPVRLLEELQVELSNLPLSGKSKKLQKEIEDILKEVVKR